MEANIFTKVLLPLALFVIMFGLGLSLTIGDFKRVVLYPKGVSIGLLNLLFISPLLGFLIATVFNLPPLLAMGVMLLAASPGGTTANYFTHLAKGDTALSVTMTAISSILTVFTIPFIINLSMNHFMDQGLSVPLPIIDTTKKILLITIIPVAIGMLLNAKAKKFSTVAAKPVRIMSLIGLALVIAGAVLQEKENIASYFVQAGPATFALNITAMTISFFMAKGFRLSNPQSTAISMELGIHNGTLAIVVAYMLDPVMAIPPAIYSLLMFFTGGCFAFLMHKRNAGEMVG